MTPPISLEVEKEFPYQRREWTVQRVGWCLMLAVLALFKAVALGASLGGGFYGGPIFPMFFMGAVLGLAIHLILPAIPIAVAVGSAMAALGAAVALLPLSMAILAAIIIQASLEAFGAAEALGALQQRAEGATVGGRALLSLYVHIPFCESVCYYCACNKVITKHHDRAAEYLLALRAEIAMHARLLGGQPVSQVRAELGRRVRHRAARRRLPRRAGGDASGARRGAAVNRQGDRRQMTKRFLTSSTVRTAVLLVGVAVLVSSCGWSLWNSPMTTVRPKSDFGQWIDEIFMLISWTTLVIFIAVEAGLLYVCWRFRDRPGAPIPNLPW